MCLFDVVRFDPGAEKRPDKESVVKDKYNTSLRNGSRSITVHLKKQLTLSLKLTHMVNNARFCKGQQKTHLF